MRRNPFGLLRDFEGNSEHVGEHDRRGLGRKNPGEDSTHTVFFQSPPEKQKQKAQQKKKKRHFCGIFLQVVYIIKIIFFGHVQPKRSGR